MRSTGVRFKATQAANLRCNAYRTYTFHLNSIPALKYKSCKLWLLVGLKFNYLATKIFEIFSRHFLWRLQSQVCGALMSSSMISHYLASKKRSVVPLLSNQISIHFFTSVFARKFYKWWVWSKIEDGKYTKNKFWNLSLQYKQICRLPA